MGARQSGHGLGCLLMECYVATRGRRSICGEQTGWWGQLAKLARACTHEIANGDSTQCPLRFTFRIEVGYLFRVGKVQKGKSGALFNNLVGAGEHHRRNRKPNCLRGLEIDDQFEVSWKLDR